MAVSSIRQFHSRSARRSPIHNGGWRSFFVVAMLFLPVFAHAWEALEDGLDHALVTVGKWAAGLEEKHQALTPGCEVSYFDNGNSSNENGSAPQTLVLVHGFSANKNLWLRIAVSLKNYHVLIPDLAGHGQSCYREGVPHTVPYYAGFLHQWLQTMGVGSVHLAGNSMGGWVAAQYALTYPSEVKTLALMDSAGVSSPVQSTFSRLQAQGDNVFFFSDEAGYDRLSQLAMVTPPALPGLVKRSHLRAYLALQPRFRQLFADINDAEGFAKNQLLDSRLGELHVPTLIVWGKQDQVVDVAMAEVFHRGIAGSEVSLLDNVGHVPMVEAAEATAAIYQQFLTAHP